jgi:RNA polymerase sigma factor (sigma-70 family)
LREILEQKETPHGTNTMPSAGLRNVIDSLRTAASLQEALSLTDGDLLERYVAGRDEVAFEALVRRHGPMVLGVCRRLLTNPCDAEDAFQATFLVLVRKAPSVLPREKVANFLYGVAYRAAQKARAATARRQYRERQVRTLPEPATVADGLWHDLVPLLDQELRRLPDKYRLPLVLCDLEGRTRTEAAEHLRWPEGTVAGRLARGRALLARRLARHGLPLSGGVLAALLADNAASACVPIALVASTGKAAAAFAGGPATAAGAVSANVTILSTGVLQAMLRDKLKVVLAGTLLAAVTLGFAGVLTHRAWSERLAALSEGARAAEPPPQDKGQGGDKKPDRAEDAAARELKALQGDWKFVAASGDGRKPASAEELKGMRWTFKGARLQGSGPGGKQVEMGEVRLDPGKDPKHIDLVAPEGDQKGKTLQGIYKLEKGRLTICLRDPGKSRPTEFTADAGSDQEMITLESLSDPPKPEVKPEPRPREAEADVMQGKRWVVKGPDALELVGPAGVVGPPVKLPRFRLEPGQELVYTGEEQSIGDQGSKSRTRGEWRVWVVKENKEDGWRLVQRSITRINAGQEIVSFTRCDLFPDGRIVENDSSGLQMEARSLLPRIPTDAAEAARGWSTTEERGGQTYRYRLLPPAKAGQCALEAVRESPLDTACGFTIKVVFTWDTERGLIETMQSEVTYADKRSQRGTMKLGEVKTHDAAWCREFAADAERYFAAEASYQHMLARQGGAPAEAKTAVEKAAADLKAVRRGLERPEFRQRVDALLAEHDQQARALVEVAERRAGVLGKPAADWSTTDLEGKPHALKDYRGKVVILDFWYRTCFWCVQAMPQVKEIAARFKDQPVVVLGMNTDAKEEDARFVVEKMGLNYANLKAAGLPEKYKVQAFPTLVVIDQEGVVRDVHVGYSPTLKEEVVQSVERLLKAKP